MNPEFVTDEHRYLTSDRRAISLGDATLKEFQVMQMVREEYGSNELLTSSIATQALFDFYLTDRVSSWANSRTIKRTHRKSIGNYIDSQERGIEDRSQQNYDYISVNGLNRAVAIVAAVSDFRINISDAQSWSPYLIETWARFGHRNAAYPLFRDLFTRKYQPFDSPDGEVVHETLMRTACVSEALVAVSGMYQAVSKGKIKEGSRTYMRSMTQGLLLEYDALLHLYETDEYSEPGHGVWHIPAPLNLDINPQSDRKVDLLSIHFSLGDCNGATMDYDVKSKPTKKQGRKKQQASPQILTAQDIGCMEIDAKGRQITTPGLVCQDYLAANQRAFNDSRFGTLEERFAYGLAIAGAGLPNLEEVYFADKQVSGERSLIAL